MSMTDPLADMLTRIRNAQQAGHKEAVMPLSSVKGEVARVLKEEGYITDCAIIEDAVQGSLKITLKYVGEERERAITNIKRESRPGLRKYVGSGDIPKILNGLGVAVVSTSSGVMTGEDARKKGLGGELLLSIY